MSPGLQLRHSQHAQSGRFQLQPNRLSFTRRQVHNWLTSEVLDGQWVNSILLMHICKWHTNFWYVTRQMQSRAHLSNPSFYVIFMTNFRSCFYPSWPSVKVGAYLQLRSFLNVEPTRNIRSSKLAPPYTGDTHKSCSNFQVVKYCLVNVKNVVSISTTY